MQISASNDSKDKKSEMLLPLPSSIYPPSIPLHSLYNRPNPQGHITHYCNIWFGLQQPSLLCGKLSKLIMVSPLDDKTFPLQFSREHVVYATSLKGTSNDFTFFTVDSTVTIVLLSDNKINVYYEPIHNICLPNHMLETENLCLSLHLPTHWKSTTPQQMVSF